MKNESSASPPTHNCVVYLRTGVNDDPWETFERIEAQRSACLSLARERGLSVVRVFKDVDASGSWRNRPGLDALRSFIANHDDVRVVVVSELTRLARGLRDWMELMAALRARGVELAHPHDEGSSEPSDAMMKSLIKALSSFSKASPGKGKPRGSSRRRAA